MMKRFLYNICVPIAALFSFASCDDKTDSDYTPGEPAPENCMTVYFDANNSADAVFEESETPTVVLTLKRKRTEQTAEVPIIATDVPSEISVPATAKFEAGQRETTITITGSAFEPSKVYKYSLSVDKEYVDPYADVYGSGNFTGNMVVASWNEYARDVAMTWTTLGVKNSWLAVIERLGDLDRFRVKNFIGSGLTFEFVLGIQSSYGKTYKTIVPLKNVEEYDDGTVKGYYFFDDEKADYPVWKVGDVEVADICFMTYYGSTDYSYVSLTERFITVGVYFTDYTDGSFDDYNYIYLQWKAENEVK